MDTYQTFADRVSLHAVRFLALVHWLALGVLVLTFMMLSSEVRAQSQPQCTGKDLIAEMAANDPDQLAQIRREAGDVKNGQGLLWKVEKPGIAPSWLFGTMHMTDPRVIDLTPAAQQALDKADTVVIEAVDAVDPQKAAAVMMQKPDLMMFTDGRTLDDFLNDDQEGMVEKALAERGMPMMAVRHMKPWVISAAIALPACEMARKKANAPFLDMKLAQDAQAADKTLLGLETMLSQMETMNSLPMDDHVTGLVATLALGDRLDDMIETMILLYENEDVGMIWPLLEAVSPKQPGLEESYATFEEEMVTKRNVGMAQNAAPIIDKGNAFIAIGALHLPGDDGVVELLRKAGYTVSRAQ